VGPRHILGTTEVRIFSSTEFCPASRRARVNRGPRVTVLELLRAEIAQGGMEAARLETSSMNRGRSWATSAKVS
jgi:hypothetical protein